MCWKKVKSLSMDIFFYHDRLILCENSIAPWRLTFSKFCRKGLSSPLLHNISIRLWFPLRISIPKKNTMNYSRFCLVYQQSCALLCSSLKAIIKTQCGYIFYKICCVWLRRFIAYLSFSFTSVQVKYKELILITSISLIVFTHEILT